MPAEAMLVMVGLRCSMHRDIDRRGLRSIIRYNRHRLVRTRRTMAELGDLSAFRGGGARRRLPAGGAGAAACPRPNLSEAVRRLEASLGVRLLNRTTRSVSPTEAGARLLERLSPGARRGRGGARRRQRVSGPAGRDAAAQCARQRRPDRPAADHRRSSSRPIPTSGWK